MNAMDHVVERDFDAERAKRPARVVRFTLGGQKFEGRATLRIGLLREIRKLTGSASNEKLIESVLGEADAQRWRDLLDDPDTDIEASDIADVAMWIFEVASDRPTGSPSDSSAGPNTAGDGSTAPSLVTAST